MNFGISSIATTNKQLPAAKNHPFNAQFGLALESFKERGLNIASAKGFQAVGQDPNEFDAYKREMFGDIQNEDTRQQLELLLDHDRDVACFGEETIKDESGSVGNVTTFAYLNGPVLRAVWARSIVPALMRAVTLKQTSYTATFDVPYMVVDGVRKDLPYSLTDQEEPVLGLKKLTPRAAAGAHIAADGSLTFTNNAVTGNLLTESLTQVIGEYDGYSVDRRIAISNIKYSTVKAVGAAAVEETLPRVVRPSSKMGKAGDVALIVEFPVKKEVSGALEEEIVTVNVLIDLSTGRYRAMTTSAAVKSFKFDAFLSSEDNRTAAMMKTEQHSIEVMIGTGQHVMIDTPVELLQEYPTSHQGSDYVVALTDIVSEFYAGNMNQEMLQFLSKSLLNSNASSYIPDTVLRGVNKADAEFDIRVAHGENPSAYMDQMLKKCLSYYINEIRSVSRIEDGFWSVIGHANNVALIPDFKTEGFAQLNGDEDTNRNDVLGFKVGYTFGFTTNVINGKVRCLYTPEIKKTTGLIGFFSSTDDKRPTYLFHPFSYTVSRGYQNANNTTLPSIMVTKRHTFEEFIPSQFRLKINGNDDHQWTSPKPINA